MGLDRLAKVLGASSSGVSNWNAGFARARITGAVLGALLFLARQETHAALFSSGNLVIYRVGSGTGSLVNTGSPIFLDEYTSGGVLVQSIPLPTSAVGQNRAIWASGTATSEGLISRSADGRYLLV